MRTGRFKFCVKRAFPFRDEVHSLAGRASSCINVFDEPLGSKTVSDNTDSLLAEIINKGFPVDRLNPSRFKSDSGFFVMRDSLKMHGLAAAGKFSLCHSRESGNPEQQDKEISRIGHIKLMLHKEIIS